LRAKLVPVPDFAADFVSAMQPADKPLVMALIAFILQSAGSTRAAGKSPPTLFAPTPCRRILSLNFRLLDENGRQLGMSRNLSELRAEWGREAKQEFSELHETPAEYSGMTDWSFGDLPELMEVGVGGGQRVLGYPGLVDGGDSVSLSVFDSPEEARQAHGAGLLRLFMLQFREPLKYLEKNLPGLNQMAMQFMALGTLDELRRQLIDLSVARACLVEPWPRDAATFRARCARPGHGSACWRRRFVAWSGRFSATGRRCRKSCRRSRLSGVRCRMSKDSSRA
jgi:ATP-dependent helicase HrpA